MNQEELFKRQLFIETLGAIANKYPTRTNEDFKILTSVALSITTIAYDRYIRDNPVKPS